MLAIKANLISCSLLSNYLTLSMIKREKILQIIELPTLKLVGAKTRL